MRRRCCVPLGPLTTASMLLWTHRSPEADKASPPTPDNALDRPDAARSGSAAGGRTPGCCIASQGPVAQPRSVHFAAVAV
jgi:hypothetical protein